MSRGPVWKDGSGNITPVKEMTDGHLLNATLYLERAFAAIGPRLASLGDIFGEDTEAARMAEEAADAYLLSDDDGPYIEDEYPIYGDLLVEIRRRRLLAMLDSWRKNKKGKAPKSRALHIEDMFHRVKSRSLAELRYDMEV